MQVESDTSVSQAKCESELWPGPVIHDFNLSPIFTYPVKSMANLSLANVFAKT